MHDTTTTNGKIRVMQAAESGKPLQTRFRHADAQWLDTPVVDTWDWLNRDFRIRPTPREYCLRVVNGVPEWNPWQESYRGTGIHVREVIE